MGWSLREGDSVRASGDAFPLGKAKSESGARVIEGLAPASFRSLARLVCVCVSDRKRSPVLFMAHQAILENIKDGIN